MYKNVFIQVKMLRFVVYVNITGHTCYFKREQQNVQEFSPAEEVVLLSTDLKSPHIAV